MTNNKLEGMITEYDTLNWPKDLTNVTEKEDAEALKKEFLGRKVSKKIKSVMVMNDYEKSKARGIKETMKFALKYIFKGTYKDFIGENDSLADAIKGEWEDATLGGKIATIFFLPIEIPILMGALTVMFGAKIVELITSMHRAPELIESLKRTGKYDLVMQEFSKRYGESYNMGTFFNNDENLLESRSK